MVQRCSHNCGLNPGWSFVFNACHSTHGAALPNCGLYPPGKTHNWSLDSCIISDNGSGGFLLLCSIDCHRFTCGNERLIPKDLL